ncbi:MAG: hypothetical protein ACOCU4_09435 [Alkalispirochaeta sp.]
MKRLWLCGPPDEVQVAEHPVLRCLREAMIFDGYSTLVENDDGVTEAEDAYSQYRQLRATADTPGDLIAGVDRLGFQWGASDGN